MGQPPSFLFLSHDNKLGDAIVLTGLFAPIKARWPLAKIGVVCGPTNALLYRAHPLVDHLHVARSRNLWARLLAGLGARKNAYEQLVHFGSDVNSHSLRGLVRLAHASRCVLFFEPSRPLASQQQVLKGPWPELHYSERPLAYLQSLGLPQRQFTYDLRLPPLGEAERTYLQSLPGRGAGTKHLVVACDASTADKSLPAAWLLMCFRLLLNHDRALRISLLCASAARQSELQSMLAALTDGGAPSAALQVAPLAGDVGLSLALIAQADVVLSADTYAVHAASAFNIPVVAVYPGDAPGFHAWAPRSQAFVQRMAATGQPIDTLSAQQISRDCESLLQQSRNSPA